MRAEEIRQHLENDPFLPLRVYISDGSSYDIDSRENAFIWTRQFIIGLDAGRNGIPQRSVYIDPVHVTRIEPILSSNGDVNGQSRH